MPVYFVGHLSTLNARCPADQAMRMGWDVTVRAEVFEGFDRRLPRAHPPAQLVGAEGRLYSGSPLYSDFGETSSQGLPRPDTVDRRGSYQAGCLPMSRIDLYESDRWEPPASVMLHG